MKTIQDALTEYVETPEFKIKITKEKTRRQYTYKLDRLAALPFDGKEFGAFPLDQLKVATCQKVYWKLLESAKGKGIRFANYTLQILTRAWNVLIRYDLLEKNPWSFVERSKEPARNTVWNNEDFIVLLNTAFKRKGWRNVGLLVRINVELGQRIEDIRMATWKNFKLNKKLYVREVIQKTGERIPGIPISDNLIEMLKEQYEIFGFQEWVVPSPVTLEPYTEESIRKIFARIRKAAGLPSVLQLRDIRRTVLTDLANCGATDTEIMSYSGHKSRESLNPYIRITTEQARNAAAKRNFTLAKY